MHIIGLNVKFSFLMVWYIQMLTLLDRIWMIVRLDVMKLSNSVSDSRHQVFVLQVIEQNCKHCVWETTDCNKLASLVSSILWIVSRPPQGIPDSQMWSQAECQETRRKPTRQHQKSELSHLRPGDLV